MTEERKISYEQSLALDAGRRKAIHAAKERAAARAPALSDDERVRFFRSFGSAVLEKRLASKRCPAADKRAIRVVLAERT